MIVIDVESNSLSRDADVLQFAAAKFIKIFGRIEYVGYINLFFWKKGYYISDEVTKITGLKKEMLQEHEEQFDNNLLILRALLHTEDLIIGKNIKSFDMPLLANFINRHTGTPYGERQKVDTFTQPHKYIDLQNSYGKTFKEEFCGKDDRFPLSANGKVRVGTLTEWGQSLNIKLTEDSPFYKACGGNTYHNALYDVFVTSEVYKHVFTPIYEREYNNYLKSIEMRKQNEERIRKTEGI